ncbi:tripartite tricarboxylate transporter TctB family protein [Devosia sp. XJ19-1]|uniref:Tripartite tricarboxylate transporter TctB family protein n=1 Tax=Devosia ureilytica TaxID=2952754 RepID=A0A9Q4AQM7_9HYPH|nr:tripartite tricarboxylate transporter TctB family protein [Devosia ureilytica]MCP8888342.1 tripartite tricarboxylate transporter TctB family protein [Devosia ureilytica]
METPSRSFNGPYVIVGVALLAVAAITVWDASTMRIRAQYGVGADAASYLIAGFLVLLAAGHFIGAFRKSDDLDAEPTDWRAIGWIALALTGLVSAIGLGAGFILGSTLLFAFTARAFGRRALLVDLLIGAALAVLVYFLFHGLLTLHLPEGPLERLL